MSATFLGQGTAVFTLALELQFNIKSLLFVITVIAALLGMWNLVGLRMFPLLGLGAILCLLIWVGIEAHEQKKGLPFWKCMAAIVLAFLPPSLFHRQWFWDHEAVYLVVWAVVGLWLSVSALWQGHSKTKIPAAFLALLYFAPIPLILSLVMDNWPHVLSYWTAQ